MVINEWIKGTISVPIFENGYYSGNEIIGFDETGIINQPTITSKSCEGNTFEIGGVYPSILSITLHLPAPAVNTYSLYGARIKLWTSYEDNPSFDSNSHEWAFRGEFWVTSVKRADTAIYNLSAADSVIWMGDTTEEGSGKGTPIPDMGNAHTMSAFADRLVDKVNNVLIFGQVVSEIEKIRTNFRADVCNDTVYEPGHAVDRTGWALLQDESFLRTVTSAPSYYLRQLAQLAAGSVQMIINPDDETPEMMIIPHGYFPNPPGCTAHQFVDDNNWLGVQETTPAMEQAWEPFTVEQEEAELGSLQIAEYTLNTHRMQFESYDGSYVASSNAFSAYRGNLTFDFTRNYFYDGRYHFSGFGFQANNIEPQSNVYKQLTQQSIRPFSVKFHKKIVSDDVYNASVFFPKIGQRINVCGNDSIITKLMWTFRGGWKAECAGGENRMLGQAARQSLAGNERMVSSIYTNIQTAGGISGLKEEIGAAHETAESAGITAESALSQSLANFDAIDDLNRRVSELEG